MHIEHIAFWVKDLEKMKDFYTYYFEATAGAIYHNPRNQFYSYFLSFTSGCRLELMQMPNIPASQNNPYQQFTGIIHLAISLGSKTKVNQLTETLRSAGYPIVGEPRTTGDGYYESVFLDPELNRIELTN